MSAIKNIIFDLGGVILNLDQQKTLQGFKNLGVNFEDYYYSLDFFEAFETGKINEDAFRDSIRKFAGKEFSDAQIDTAWNAMLLDLPAERIEILKDIRTEFDIYLLSNTNSIHIRSFLGDFNRFHSGEEWDSLFNKIYYSHQVGLRKPDAAIYEYVLADISAKGNECIFIDDNQQNLAGANSSGIHTIWANEPLSYFTLDKIYALAGKIY